jgi:MinD-like ATPase involved in chromosome partitioning or flagellar assembly
MFDGTNDQAQGLRRMFAPARPRVIVLAGEETGRSEVALALAEDLSLRGESVVLLDQSDGGVPRLLGKTASHELSDAVAGTRTLLEVAFTSQGGAIVVPAVHGLEHLCTRHPEPIAYLERELRREHDSISIVLVNARAKDLTLIARALRDGARFVLVSSEADDSLTGAYAQAKLLRSASGVSSFDLLVARTPDEKRARTVLTNLARAARRFLRAEVRLIGYVSGPGTSGAVSVHLARNAEPAAPARRAAVMSLVPTPGAAAAAA